MTENLNARLRWLEEELKAQEEPVVWPEQPEPEDELWPGYNYAQDMDRAMYWGVDYKEIEEEPPKKKNKKGIKGLVLLAALELAAICVLLRWWLRWLT